MNSRLTWFLVRHMAIIEFQCEFHGRRSTVDNLLTLENKLWMILYVYNIWSLIFFDLEKAYVTGNMVPGIILYLFKRVSLVLYLCSSWI